LEDNFSSSHMTNQRNTLCEFLPRLDIQLGAGNGWFQDPVDSNNTKGYSPLNQFMTQPSFLIYDRNLHQSMHAAMRQHLQGLEIASSPVDNALANALSTFNQDMQDFSANRTFGKEKTTDAFFTRCQSVVNRSFRRLYPEEDITLEYEKPYMWQKIDIVMGGKLHVEFKSYKVFDYFAPKIVEMEGKVPNLTLSETGARAVLFKVHFFLVLHPTSNNGACFCKIGVSMFGLNLRWGLLFGGTNYMVFHRVDATEDFEGGLICSPILQTEANHTAPFLSLLVFMLMKDVRFNIPDDIQSKIRALRRPLSQPQPRIMYYTLGEESPDSWFLQETLQVC
jgi:hypothetical protein